MSKRADGLIADYLDNRWSVTDKQTNVTIAANVSPNPVSNHVSVVLDAIHWTIANMNALGCTMTAEVRDVSIAGTVLAQWALFVPGSTTAQVSPTNLKILGTKGKSIFFRTDTVVASVTASVVASGWFDGSSDY